MMKISAYIFAIIVALTLFIGCSDFSTERKQVADLMDQVDEAKKVFDRSHPDSLEVKDSDIKDRIDIISDHYRRNQDTMDFDLSLLLADFKGYRKAFRGLGDKRHRISTEMDNTYVQLSDLDNDLKNGSIEKGKVGQYLKDERSATEALTTSIYKLDTLLKRGASGYYKYVDRIDSVMNSLGAPE